MPVSPIIRPEPCHQASSAASELLSYSVGGAPLVRRLLNSRVWPNGDETTANARHVPKGYRVCKQNVRRSAKFALKATLALFFIVTGCDRHSGSPVRIHLHDVPDTRSQPGTTRETRPWSCPPGHPDGNHASFSPAEGHVVNLSWNASPSSSKPNHRQISYCLYRSKGQPIQSSGATKIATSPCTNCQRVTIEPIVGTNYKDIHVENNTHYCYVAIAIENGNMLPSAFSNQADAVIPPRKEPPLCNVDAKATRNRPIKYRP
jgi:hypothetical protein